MEQRTDYREKALRAIGTLPPFSPVLNKLLASLAQDKVSFSAVGELIEKDTVMAGGVLHLVNSALYGRRGTINSVRHAVALLGINKLRNAVLGMSITRLWSEVKTPQGWSMARFNGHSAATAVLADLLAQHLEADYPEGAFIAGLLHDVGRLLIALGLREEHGAILRLYERSGRSLVECEREVIGVTHPELSAAAIAHWNLPLPIQLAAEHHHRPAADPTPVAPGAWALSSIVHVANQHVNSAGISVFRDLNPADQPPPDPLEALGLGDGLPALLEQFQSEYEAMAGFFR
jgi:HD-like signal output (HDOD) protein